VYNGASVQSTTVKKTSAVLTAGSLAARPQDVEKTFLINNTGPWDSGVHSYNYCIAKTIHSYSMRNMVGSPFLTGFGTAARVHSYD
jgi:hypothetical protein